MADLKALTRELLASGAPIQDMNTVRKHLSRDPGRAARARHARARAGAGDLGRDRRRSDAHRLRSVRARSVDVRGRARDPRALRRAARPPRSPRISTRGAQGEIAETPKPGDPLFTHAENRVIATAHASLMAAAAFVQAHGVTPLVLGDSVTGESREVAKVYGRDRAAGAAARASVRSRRWRSSPAARPRSRCAARGAAGAAASSCSRSRWSSAGRRHVALACDTDGIDGSEDNAGAILAPDSLGRAHAKGARSQAAARGQRRLRVLLRARRPRRHGADAHQRQRLPRDPRPMSRHDGVLAALALVAGVVAIAFTWQPGLASLYDDSVFYLMMAQAISPFGQASPAVLAATPFDTYPPMLPVLLALFGGAFDWRIAHAIVAACLRCERLPAGAARAAHDLLRARWDIACALVYALLPGAWLNVKGILSEFPYMALSFGILVLYERARERAATHAPRDLARGPAGGIDPHADRRRGAGGGDRGVRSARLVAQARTRAARGNRVGRGPADRDRRPLDPAAGPRAARTPTRSSACALPKPRKPAAAPGSPRCSGRTSPRSKTHGSTRCSSTGATGGRPSSSWRP